MRPLARLISHASHRRRVGGSLVAGVESPSSGGEHSRPRPVVVGARSHDPAPPSLDAKLARVGRD